MDKNNRISPSFFRLAWFVSILAMTALACNTVNQIGQTSGTAQAVITQGKGLADEGKSLAETAQAWATENGGPILQTAQAYATENPGIVETAQAFVTQEGPKFLSTAESFATENPGILQTLEARVTQIGSESPDSPPEDIPVLPHDQVASFYGNRSTVSYLTTLDYGQVVDFYKSQMLENGWQPVSEGTVETSGLSVLNYTKSSRDAHIIITDNSGNQQTSVLISITTR